MTAPPRSSRALLSVCAGLLLALQGCDDSPVPLPTFDASTVEDSGTPDAGTVEDSGTPDAGEVDSGTPDASTDVPWDGGYTVLPERGNWMDRGSYAPCTFDASGDPATVACDDLSRYDLSQCDPAALAGLEPHGIYLADLRTERRLADGGTRVTPSFTSFKLVSDGGTDTLGGAPVVLRNTDGGTFFVVGKLSNPIIGTIETALVGCKVPSPGIITGCFARCLDGRFGGTGTFEAHRPAVHPGEAESSGGLELISEARVLLGEPADVYVTKNHAYVVSFGRFGLDGGLTVFDITDRRFPILKTAISIPGDNYWNGVWAKGDALYVASIASGTIVFDITNPAAPEFLRGLPSGPEGTHTVLVDGDRLYAMSLNGATYVYDVSSPLAPVLLQTIALSEELSSGGPHDAFAYEGRLYVSNGFGGYSVMDVTDLENVRHLGQFVHGGQAYAHTSAVGTFAGRTIAFEGGETNGAHLRVLDVTDPANIVKIGEHRRRPVTSIHNMILKGNRLYIAWYQEGLRVLDVSNPTRPRPVAHYHTFRETDPERTDNIYEGAFGVRVPGDGSVYVVDSARGLLILDEP
ncbi:LVIVD repeat-containing protein [Pyxidicoccus sp. 3LG]